MPPAANQLHEPTTNPNNNKFVSTGKSDGNRQLPLIASNIDDFINNNTTRERGISTSSGDNDDDDYEPYSRRDFRIDVKPNDTSSGYFTSPNEHEKSTIPSIVHQHHRPTVFSPESSDYEKFEYQKNIIKNRDEFSSSPADSQSGRSAISRKSVSFDLDVDVEEYTPTRQTDEMFEDELFYEKSRPQHQQFQTEPKLIKGILRSVSPNVYRTAGAIDDDYDGNEKENPFRKEYLSSQEQLNAPLGMPPSAISDANIRSSFDNLSVSSTSSSSQPSKIPIKKPIFKSTGSLVDRPKIPPPPRPPKPTVKVAEMVKNEGLERMSRQMEQQDFLEFVHDVETNKVHEIEIHDLTFDPDDPLPPLPNYPPPEELPTTSVYKRSTSLDRPKDSPPLPPPPKCHQKEEILEILPAKFDKYPIKQRPHYVNENSQRNILVTEDEHREILLTENELRNAIITEYDEPNSTFSAQSLTNPFSPNAAASADALTTNPFLDYDSSFDSYRSSPNLMSPNSTLEKSVSSIGYSPSYQSLQHVQPINILPPPPQVLPVHYGQLPKPQHAGYYPLMSSQYQIQRPTQSATGLSIQMQQPSHQMYIQQHQHIPETTSSAITSPASSSMVFDEQRTYVVSGEGQNNFYVTHNNVNNTNANNQQNHPQTLLMQSAYSPLPSTSSYLHQNQYTTSLPMSSSTSQQYLVSTNAIPQSISQPQFIYEQQQMHQQHLNQQQQNMLNNNTTQYVHQRQFIETELSPIRVNQIPQHFVYAPGGTTPEPKPTMSTFGKQTEV